jgi:hypothetical protein
MATKTIPLEEATKEQLRAFGRDYAGISFPGFTGEAKMRAAIAEAGYDEIKVADAPAEKPKAASPKPKPAAPKPKPEEADEEKTPQPEPPLTAAEKVAGNAAEGEDPSIVRERIKRDAAFMRVTIPKQQGDGGDEPVTLVVNGKALRVERGKPQLIRMPYYLALKNSEERHFDFMEGDGNAELKPRTVPSYPYSAEPA